MSSSKLKGGGVGSVLWHESIRELRLGNSAIGVPVVTLNEKENILLDGIYSINREGLTEFRSR